MKSLTLPILLIASFKPKKSDGQNSKNFVDKTTTFIKENAGKLVFVAHLPVLIEEALASYKGFKMAKPLLNKTSMNFLYRHCGKAFLSYLGSAVALSFAARAASWLHDKILQPNNTK